MIQQPKPIDVGPKTLSVAPQARQGQSTQTAYNQYQGGAQQSPAPSYINPTNPQQMLAQKTQGMMTAPPGSLTPTSTAPSVMTAPPLQAQQPALGLGDIRNQFANKFQEVMGRAGTEADWQGQTKKEGFGGEINQDQLNDYFKRATAQYAPTNQTPPPTNKHIPGAATTWLQPGQKLSYSNASTAPVNTKYI